MEIRIFFLFCLFCIASCTNKFNKRANELAHKFIIVDGHVDLPFRLKVKNFRLEKEYLGIPIKTKEGDFDYERAMKGGLTAPFMSIYIPASYKPEDGKKLADSLINMVNYIADNHKAYYQVASTPKEVNTVFQSKRIALPMGMENGSPIATLDDVDYFRSRGISYITLTHSKNNQICDSSYDTTRMWNGLSPFGYDVVRRMNEAGVMVDISHVSDSAAMDVLRFTKIPVIASHSSVRKYTPGFERNMSDEVLLKLKENNGVIMINFGTDFLDGEKSNINKENSKNLDNILAARNLKRGSPEEKKFIAAYKKSSPTLYADVQKVADHIDHVMNLIGEDHIGLGSDYDGVGDSLPKGLKDADDYPNLIAELLKRGYSETQIEKICYKNVFRVWDEVISYSNGVR